MLDILALVGGLVLLTVAADRFVLGAARLATALRLSAVLVGALVIGFGTSAPELVVTVLATLAGSQDLAFGNVVGSNTANVLLVLGAAALVRPLVVEFSTLRRELPVSLAAVALLAIVTVDGRVGTGEAVLLLAAAVGVVALIVHAGARDRVGQLALEAEVATYEGASQAPVWRTVVLTLAGLAGTLVGAQLLVTGATGLARSIGITEAVIGLTIVAIGTSLPELVTALAAARRGETDLIVGNVLGSNIFNALPVAGVAGLLDTMALGHTFRLAAVIMVVASALAAFFLRTGARLARGEAVVLLVGFVAATVAVALR